jgi:hypothetical protein
MSRASGVLNESQSEARKADWLSWKLCEKMKTDQITDFRTEKKLTSTSNPVLGLHNDGNRRSCSHSRVPGSLELSP